MKKLSFAIVAFLGLSVGAMAQTAAHDVTITIPPVTMLAIKNTGTVAIEYTAPAVAGDAIAGPTVTPASGDMYLQFSSIMAPAATGRKIAVTTTGSALTQGLSLKVTAGSITTGGGMFGTSNADVSLLAPTNTLTTDATVITGITSCYTGTGAADGSKITYAPIAASASALTSAQYAALRAGTYTVTVTYTLSDI